MKEEEVGRASHQQPHIHSMHLTPNPTSQLKERLKKRNQQRMDARKQRQKEVCYTLHILSQTRIGVGGPLQLWAA